MGASDAIPLRPFGRTNDRISALGLGGHHLGDARNVEEAIRIRTGETGADAV